MYQHFIFLLKKILKTNAICLKNCSAFAFLNYQFLFWIINFLLSLWNYHIAFYFSILHWYKYIFYLPGQIEGKEDNQNEGFSRKWKKVTADKLYWFVRKRKANRANESNILYKVNMIGYQNIRLFTFYLFICTKRILVSMLKDLTCIMLLLLDDPVKGNFYWIDVVIVYFVKIYASRSGRKRVFVFGVRTWSFSGLPRSSNPTSSIIW